MALAARNARCGDRFSKAADKSCTGRSQARLDIVSGTFKTGDILPGDAELMERLKVSRTVLREAMKTLTAKGMISPRHASAPGDGARKLEHVR